MQNETIELMLSNNENCRLDLMMMLRKSACLAWKKENKIVESFSRDADGRWRWCRLRASGGRYAYGRASQAIHFFFLLFPGGRGGRYPPYLFPGGPTLFTGLTNRERTLHSKKKQEQMLFTLDLKLSHY
jgi:hypothetical protein